MNELIQMIMLGAAIAALSMTLTKAEITMPLRRLVMLALLSIVAVVKFKWVQKAAEKVGYLVTCPYCSSHWISLLVVVLFRPNVHVYDNILMNIAVLTMALVAISALWVLIIYNAYKK